MPNFNTHWLVALQAVSSAPPFIGVGKARYEWFTREFKSRLVQIVREADDDTKAAAIAQSVRSARADWETGLRVTPPQVPGSKASAPQVPGTWDDVACFSAFMLGACGPDFWTLPSESKHGLIPDFAGKHFDLGHYNRTHRQFQVSVPRVAGGASLQAKVHQSYFLGLSTHIAADLVVHQLVNVYAGAYNFLEKRWENEQGYFTKNIWSTHNKVEHYWDTYVRYRLLGDLDPFWDPGVRADVGGAASSWVSHLDFPVRESLVRLVEARKTGRAKAALLKALGQDPVRFDIEKPLMFPWVFCDRVGDDSKPGDLQPFIYDVVVEKSAGAYPAPIVFQAAQDEAAERQMQDAVVGHSERKKLAFFTSDRNASGQDPNTSHNYLTYIVCPDVEKARRFGADGFFEVAGLKAFVERAGALARIFVTELKGAYENKGLSGAKPDQVKLHNLGRFWNLDTGLGLQLQRVRSSTDREVITRLDFVHALEVAAAGPLAYSRNAGYLAGRTRATFSAEAKQAFLTDATCRNFPSLDAVFEEDGRFLERIVVGSPDGLARPPDKYDEGTFFSKFKVAAAPTEAQTCTLAGQGVVRLEARDIHLRLNLAMRVPIAAIGALTGRERLGLFLYGDQAIGLDGSAKELSGDNVKTHEWVKAVGRGGLLEFQEATGGSDRSGSGLRVFETRLLANLEPSKTLEWKGRAGEWNNVVPYEAHRAQYGRNFAIGTGRSDVLKPNDSGNFSQADFDAYSDVSPTEQVFLTVYPLVRTPDGVFDVFSKEPVDQSRLAELKKIDAVGFVKIVLLYELGQHGAVHFDTCFVDGLPVAVVPVND